MREVVKPGEGIYRESECVDILSYTVYTKSDIQYTKIAALPDGSAFTSVIYADENSKAEP